MHTIVVGVNYRTAPVEIREKLSFVESDLPKAMESLQEQKSILENIIVSTCNRTEIYASRGSITYWPLLYKTISCQLVSICQLNRFLLIYSFMKMMKPWSIYSV